jgi:hypothetical protein
VWAVLIMPRKLRGPRNNRGRANSQYNACINKVNSVTGFAFDHSVYTSHSAEQLQLPGLSNLAIPNELFGNKFPDKLCSHVKLRNGT